MSWYRNTNGSYTKTLGEQVTAAIWPKRRGIFTKWTLHVYVYGREVFVGTFDHLSQAQNHAEGTEWKRGI